VKKTYTVSILGTLPPIRALSSYCFELTDSLAFLCLIEFISFKKIYPSFLYPGGNPDDDHSYPELSATDIRIRRHLTWYNPFSWIGEGFGAKGDILHAQWWSPPLFFIYFTVCACFKLRRKPVILTVHNLLPHEHSLVFFKMSQLLFRLGDHFIVHSTINKQQMITTYGISPEKISVIPHGSLDFHVKKNADRETIRHEMGFEKENRIILLFGAIRSYKGIDTAIRALAETIKKVPAARLLIAGRLWEDWTPYETLIHDLGIKEYVILNLEYIPSGDVYKFFEASDLCIFPYHHFDSQSGAASVALSFRKPMIVSKVGGLPEFVKDNRFIVPPRDPHLLAEAIVKCLKNPTLLEDMRTNAETVSNEFAWPEIAKQTEKIYQKLLLSS
jgi:glycosyltransferase involved in cell wall biosynthesis